jgi:uncharacterized protein (TIGR00297 family)
MDWSTLSGNALPAVLVNLALALAAYRGGGVRGSGVVGGLAVGIPIYLFLGWRGFSILVGFFVVGTAVTRLGYSRKERRGVAEERRGARGASHALANAGVAVLCALGVWIDGDPRWGIAFTAALATAAMDTAGTEVGSLWGRRTISLGTFRPVAAGTPGAVSLEGSVAGVLAALLLAVLSRQLGLISSSGVAAVVLGAVAGNLYEGILGARGVLSHGWLNATNTAVGALCAALVAGRG